MLQAKQPISPGNIVSASMPTYKLVTNRDSSKELRAVRLEVSHILCLNRARKIK